MCLLLRLVYFACFDDHRNEVFLLMSGHGIKGNKMWHRAVVDDDEDNMMFIKDKKQTKK